jgi:EAL domain-containing protein (putative c-di-GMP-specific phosphodiesterase class I)/ActR/RegA family two-component response regulator
MNATRGEKRVTSAQGAPCFIVEENPQVGRFITRALSGLGVASEHFLGVPQLVSGLQRHIPELVFLDISLADSDAIEAIHALAAVGFGGAVQLMSGSNTSLLDDVRQVGARHGLRMRPTLTKPFRIDAVKTVVEEEKLGSGTSPTAEHAGVAGATELAATSSIDLREAINRKWVELWYQPKFDLARAQIDGAEGLARVRHPDLGLLSPASFIPNASNEDLVALAEYALQTVLRDIRDLAFVGHQLRLAINVPVEALLTLPIPAMVREARPRDGGAWPGIILEVTEDQVIRDIATAHEIATQLRIYQVSLAIDDFGKGYSSLARLRELPFGELKLDQSFVQNSGADVTNATLCKLVVDLAHRFGAVAVAEGIETPSELEAIQRIGCDIGQGYLFDRPMPKEVFIARLITGDARS